MALHKHSIAIQITADLERKTTVQDEVYCKGI